MRSPGRRCGFFLVGFGCTTCIGNSGPLAAGDLGKAINDNELVAAACALGQPQLRGPGEPRRARELPGLAAAGRRLRPRGVDADRLVTEPLGTASDGKPVYLKDIWPSQPRSRFIEKNITQTVKPEMFKRRITPTCSSGDDNWKKLVKVRPPARPSNGTVGSAPTCSNPPYFEGMQKTGPRRSRTSLDARVLGLFLDSITTDHISPAGSIKRGEPGRQIPDGPSGPPRRTSTSTARAAATTK